MPGDRTGRETGTSRETGTGRETGTSRETGTGRPAYPMTDRAGAMDEAGEDVAAQIVGAKEIDLFAAVVDAKQVHVGLKEAEKAVFVA